MGNWSRPAEVLENWRTPAAEHQIPQENRYLQGYEDNLDVLVQTRKETDKNDKDRPHLCRAVWRRKRARRRHVDRQKKLECCEEGRAPPVKTKSKHINWSRVFGEEEVPKALSTAQSSSSRTQLMVKSCNRTKTVVGESVAHAFG